MQLCFDWLLGLRIEPGRPDAKGAGEPGSRDTEKMTVFSEPGSGGGVVQAHWQFTLEQALNVCSCYFMGPTKHEP